MSEDKAIVKVEAEAPEQYATDEQLNALAGRVKEVMPGGDKLSASSALATAEAAFLMDANFMMGDIYAYEDYKGKLVLVEGYKILVRWAQKVSGYSTSDRFLTEAERKAEGLKDGDIGVYLWLLRDDKREQVAEFTKLGASFREAFEMVAMRAVGVVAKGETWSAKYNKAVAPPVGWTWPQVATKRALKTAIRWSYGTPSPREMQAEAKRLLEEAAGGGPTITIQDLRDAQAQLPSGTRDEQLRLAALNAQDRKLEAEASERTPEEHAEILKRNNEILHGPQDFDGFDPEPIEAEYTEVTDATDATPPPIWDDDGPPEGACPNCGSLNLWEGGCPDCGAAEKDPTYTREDAAKEQEAAKNKLEELVATLPAVPPGKIRKALRERSAWELGKDPELSDAKRLDGEPITDKQLSFAGSLLAEAVEAEGDSEEDTSKKRHDVLQYLFGVRSTKLLTKKEATATIGWLHTQVDGEKGLRDGVRAEVGGILTQFAKDIGQESLPGM